GQRVSQLLSRAHHAAEADPAPAGSNPGAGAQLTKGPPVFASLLLVAAALSAQAPDTTFAIRAGDRLRGSTREGDITVRSWNRNEVEIRSGDRDDRRSRGVNVSRSGSVITVDAMRGWMGSGGTDVVIRMPTTVALSANSIEGDVTVDGIAAAVSVETVEGDV